MRVMRKPTKTNQQYWDGVLKDHHLGMDRGRNTKLEYSGDTNDLDIVHTQKITKKLGRKKPKGRAD